MKIQRELSGASRRALACRKHSDREKECKLLLAEFENCSKFNCVDVVSKLDGPAQALKGRSKYAEGLKARLHARDMLIYLIVAV
jgi:hypothetical protein